MSYVLVIEDDPATREAIQDLLEITLPDVVVRFAADAAEALAHLDAQFPETVLLDATLNNASGTELARLIRRRSTHHRARLVGMTGLNQFSAAYDDFRALCDEMLPKPFSLDELLQSVQTVPPA